MNIIRITGKAKLKLVKRDTGWLVYDGGKAPSAVLKEKEVWILLFELSKYDETIIFIA